ncbi:uncharacterized protein LOC127740707 isoform X2 [Arachis duranensis]|uniref:Uncharacterized protein LOC127740707 isoform X2 n=1 Tax=Arachis duranensis TaxID=130453 RepID=A0A9C6T6H6_ARADU|nr:uncharacterized protein LOC127740707 isoform X2 [Arachis duranensis]
MRNKYTLIAGEEVVMAEAGKEEVVEDMVEAGEEVVVVEAGEEVEDMAEDKIADKTLRRLSVTIDVKMLKKKKPRCIMY